MTRLKTSVCALALLAMTAEANAAELCDLGSANALKTAAVQQEFMVAGFTCDASNQYNRFVTAYRTELQVSDAALMNYFRQRDGNEAGYDTYKTKLANLSASRSAADGARYCQAINREFTAASRSQTLKDFIAGDHLLIAAPEACAVKFDMPDVAVAGPSYDLPATPYGAAPPARVASASRARDNVQAANAPAVRRYQRDQAADDYYSYYGPPPGWLPPQRPVRREDWYGRSAYNGYYDD